MKFRTGIYFPVDGVTLLILSPFIHPDYDFWIYPQMACEGCHLALRYLDIPCNKDTRKIIPKREAAHHQQPGITKESRAGLFDRHGSMIRW